jgi:ectoine hydroxylase-related dioxygenase (phytanoyl-CoA dioxygenase family)
MRITDEHIEALREDGYVVVDPFLTEKELEAAQADIHGYFPTREQYLAAPEKYRALPRLAGFPFTGSTLNHVTTHPELISFLEQLLGTAELELGEALVQAKYSGPAVPTADELMHCDAWGKNQLVYPRDDGIFRQVPMILYYSEVEPELGCTFVVSQKHTRGLSLLPPTRSRDEHPELYALERPVRASAGSLLVMSPRTFHRGSQITAERAARFVHFMTYRSAATRWMESQNWPSNPPQSDTPMMRSFMETATPRQREMLGFPAPGHEYWNEETLRGVAMRFPNMDMTPYREAYEGFFLSRQIGEVAAGS